jgi:multisubunit Na+/H+ antiporter MnhC subunit
MRALHRSRLPHAVVMTALAVDLAIIATLADANWWR